MIKHIIVGTMILGAAGVAGMAYSPALRTTLDKHWANRMGWTEDARQADPVGFADHAQDQLENDRLTMERTRHELAAEADRLDREIRHQVGLADSAEHFAREFRTAYHKAAQENRFSLMLHRAAYTQQQAEAQIRLLLAEAESCRKTVAKLKKVRKATQTQIEELAVRINETEAQIAAISAKSKLLHVRQISDDRDSLLAQVENVMNGRSADQPRGPIRSTPELIAAQPEDPANDSRDRAVQKFLAQKPAAKTDKAKSNEPAKLPTDSTLATKPAPKVIQDEVVQPAGNVEAKPTGKRPVGKPNAKVAGNVDGAVHAVKAPTKKPATPKKAAKTVQTKNEKSAEPKQATQKPHQVKADKPAGKKAVAKAAGKVSGTVHAVKTPTKKPVTSKKAAKTVQTKNRKSAEPKQATKKPHQVKTDKPAGKKAVAKAAGKVRIGSEIEPAFWQFGLRVDLVALHVNTGLILAPILSGTVHAVKTPTKKPATSEKAMKTMQSKNDKPAEPKQTAQEPRRGKAHKSAENVDSAATSDDDSDSKGVAVQPQPVTDNDEAENVPSSRNADVAILPSAETAQAVAKVNSDQALFSIESMAVTIDELVRTVETRPVSEERTTVSEPGTDNSVWIEVVQLRSKTHASKASEAIGIAPNRPIFAQY